MESIIQAMPSQVEVDVQDQPVVSPWMTLVVIPLILAGVAVIQKWVPTRSDHVTSITTAYRDQISTLVTQVKTLVEQQAAMQTRLTEMEEKVARADHRGDRAERIAHKALDRVDDHVSYLQVRIAARDMNDPEKELTPWVPDPPPHLIDGEWTQRHRADLEALDD
ncbi:hypothetical protein SFC07_10980 [Corynebacterium callunae]|uniref:hypothetical protein n=1 Tax=Corynebacterium callunae TaxID=1721 RepID=UPI00398226C6